MTGKIEHVEVITSVQWQRRWSAEEQAAIVQETYAPGMSVWLVARRHGIAPNQLFRWRWLYADGALSAVGASEEVAPASEYRALQSRLRELQRLLGKKTLENRILREALDLAPPKKTAVARDRPRPCGTIRREDDRRCARDRPLKPGHACKRCHALQYGPLVQGARLLFAARVPKTAAKGDDRERDRRWASTA
jgi:transposase